MTTPEEMFGGCLIRIKTACDCSVPNCWRPVKVVVSERVGLCEKHAAKVLIDSANAVFDLDPDVCPE